MMYYPMYFDPTYILVSEDEFHIQQIFQSKESFRYDRKGCGRTDSSQRRPV